MGQNSIVVAISFSPPDILERARQRARSLGFRHSFSAYVTKLVQDDLDSASLAQGHQAAAKFLNDADAHARGATTEPHTGEKITTYRAGRKTKKKPTP